MKPKTPTKATEERARYELKAALVAAVARYEEALGLDPSDGTWSTWVRQDDPDDVPGGLDLSLVVVAPSGGAWHTDFMR